MPAARPRASFEPIPPDFDVSTFVDESDNFQYVDRISYEMVEANGIEQFEKLVLLHVIIGGKPLVIDGFEEILDPYVFTPSWLQHNCGDKVENARNLTTKEDLPLTIRHYLKHLGKLTNQFFDNSERNQDKPQQRIYLKDIDCPEPWQEKMKEYIPLGFYYLNESTGLPGGPGALEEMGGRRGRGIARAGDLMSSLPPEMRADNLMCYIGHEGTYTPAHREMCASLGQNLMVSASSSQAGDDGQMEHPGSSLWFMTETKDRHLVSEYWLSVLGHDIEVEKHFAQLIAWKKAPFKTYVVEQRPGDFILIPPLAPHQVWNRGTYTMKIAWNRTTVETLEMAFSEALPNSRIVCRDEQYKNKAIVYFTLLKYSSLIRLSRGQVERGSAQAENIRRSTKVRQVQRDFKRLFNLYTQILLSEMLAPVSRTHVDFLPYDSNVTCAYCRCNIFNRFLTCKSCKNMFGSDIEEPYDICMDCYCMGRSCGCQSGYTWVEQWKWKDLVDRYEEWRALIIEIERYNAETAPLSLQEEREYLGKKTLAQVCQEQLELRPFVDIKNPPRENKNVSDDEEIEVDDDGKVKKTAKKRKSKRWLAQHKSCHFCLHRHPIWKMAFCTSCDLAYCYGSLFRAHDMMPLTIMEDPHWKCPHCRKVCNTGACRRNPNQHPYEPKGTLLGHDTRKVADVRSVECLIDFSKSNLNWLREDDGSGPSVLQRRHQEAEKAKMADPSLDARYLDEDQYDDPKDITYSPMEDSNGGVYDMGLHDTGGPGFINPALMRDPSYDPFYNNIARDPSLGNVGEKRTWSDSDDQMDNGGRRSKGAPKKRKKNDARMPKNLLEQAQKDDRFILLAAKMKGRSKVVKLPLRPELLEQIQRRPVSVNLQNLAQQALEQDDFGDRQPNLQPTTSLIAPTASVARSTNTILQSDVLHHARSASASGRKEKPGRPPKDQTAALPVGLPDGENDVDDVQPVAHINSVDIESPIDGKRRSGRLPKDRTAALPVGPPTKEVDEVNDTQRTDHTTSNNVGPKSPMGRKRRPGRPPKDQTVALPIGLPIDEPDEIDSTQPTDFNSPNNMGTETPTGSEKRPGGPPKDRVTFSVSSIKNPSIRSRNHEAGEAVNPHEDEESNAKVHSGNSNSPHLVSVSSIGKRRPGRPPKDRKAAFPIGLPNDEQDEHSSAQPAVDYNSSRDIHNGDSIGKKKKPGRHPKDRKTVLPVGLPTDGTDESGNEELVLGQNNSPNMGSHGAIGKRRSGRPPKDRKIDLPVGLLNDGFRNAPPASENTDSPLAATGSVMSRKRKPGRPSKIRARALSIEPADESNHVQSIPGHEAWKKRINGRKDEGNATLPLDAKNDDIGDQHLASPSKSLSGAGPAGVVRKKKISKGQQKEGKWALPVNDHNEQDFYDEPNRAYMPTLPAASATPEVPMTEEEKRLQENLRVKIALYEEFDDHDPVFNGFIGRLAAEDEPLAHEAH